MTKSYFTTAALLLASALSVSAAQSESDFTLAKEQALARLTSWSEASPYAPEALTAGIADLNAITYSAYPDGDAAVKGINDRLDQIKASAREELKVNVYRIFVSITNDAMTTTPINGGSLLGSIIDEDKTDGVTFMTHASRNQFSTWIFNIIANEDGVYSLRNNSGHYMVFPEYDSEEIKLSRYPANSGPFVGVDFADNGKMMLTYGEKYLATDAEGQLYLSTTFGPESSWTMKRATDSKFDKPIISTKENPVYYIIRNANYPTKALTPKDNGIFTVLGGVSDGNQWYFVDCGRRNGSFYAYSKSGYFLGSSATGYMYSYSSGIPGPIYCYLRDGSDDIGMCMTMRSEGVYVYSDDNPGTIYYNEHNDGFYANINKIKNSFHDWTSNPGIFSWYFEPSDGTAFRDFIAAKEECSKKLSVYLTSQPWATDYLKAALEEIDNMDLGDYEDVDAATAAMDAIATKAESGLAAQIANEIPDYFARKGRVSLYNARRTLDKADPSAPLAAIANDTKITFNTRDIQPDSTAVWEFEAITGKTGSFRIKNLTGKYLGALKANNPVEGVEKLNAAEYKIAVRDGYVMFTNSTGRSAMFMDETDGSLTAGQPANEGSLWILKNTILINSGKDAPKVSTRENPIYYVIRSVNDTTKYLQSDEDRTYVYHKGKSLNSYVYLTQAEDGVGVYIHSMEFDDQNVSLGYWTSDECAGPVWYFFKAYRDTEFVWYITPNEYGDKKGYNIVNKYPVDGACAISLVSGPGLSQISCGFGDVSDYKNTAWEFVQEEVDHEGIFNDQRNIYVNLIKNYQKNQPWLKDGLQSAVDYLTSVKMTDLGEKSTPAINKLNLYMIDILEQFEEDLELEPEGHVVSISNLYRAGEGQPSYLAAVNGFANTSSVVDENSTWTLEYYNNGRYNLVNDKGLYLGELSDQVTVTSDPDLAGHYQVALYGGYVCLVDRNNPTARVLNVDNNGNAAKVTGQAEEGSHWVIKDVRASSIKVIESAENGLDSTAEYYDVRGIKVDGASLTRGIYLMRQGSTVNKIIVK